MAQPIFTRQDTQLNGVFSSDKAKLQFSEGVNGVLVQGMNFTYSQQVTRLYEIGSADGTGQGAAANAGGQKTNVYYVGGRTQGQLQLNRVIGPKATIKQLYEEYGDVCKACDNNIELVLNEVDCCDGGGSANCTYICKFCVLVQVGVSLQAQDMIINEQSQIMFSGLDIDDQAAPGGNQGFGIGAPGAAAAGLV
jgi:hypothetical protein